MGGLGQQRLRILSLRPGQHLRHVQVVAQVPEARHRAREVPVGARVVGRLPQRELHHRRAFLRRRTRPAQRLQRRLPGLDVRRRLRLRQLGHTVGLAQRADDLGRPRAVRAAERERTQRRERVRHVARLPEVVPPVPDLAVGKRSGRHRRRGLGGRGKLNRDGDGVCFGGGRDEGEGQACGRGGGEGARVASREASPRKPPRKQHEHKPGDEKPAEAFRRAQLLLLGLFLRRDLAKETAVDRAERRLRRARRRERHVPPATRLRDFNERLLLKLCRHGLALVLLRTRAGGVGDGAPPLRVAEAHGEDRDVPLCRRAGRFERVAAQVAAVRDEQDRVVVVRRRVQRVECRLDRAAEIRLAARRRIRRRALQCRAQETVVGRERAEEDARAAERDERAPVALQRVDEVHHIRLRAFQAVRPHVRREHRTRDVQRHHHIARARLERLLRMAPLRPRRREHHEQQPRQDEHRLYAEKPRAARHQAPLQRGRDKAVEPLLRARAQPQPHRAHDRHKREKCQHPGIDEFHGFRF